MAYHVKIKKSAEKELEKLPLREILSLKQKILSLSNTPFPPGFRKLRGFGNQYRIRVGNYRVIYSIEQSQFLVEILKIGHRKHIYR